MMANIRPENTNVTWMPTFHANLLIIIIFAGYENFVSKIDEER